MIWIGVRNTKRFKELIALVGHLALIGQSKLKKISLISIDLMTMDFTNGESF
ncbi:hypothetical protein VCR17J2_760054 [Vibrio coralliirubri]|nr:hypothetical protein VCR17J2_760054 [Vibrio coralliirubri]